MKTTLAFIQRRHVLGDDTWRFDVEIVEMLQRLHEKGVLAVIVWSGTSKPGDDRIDAVFSPFAEFSKALKKYDAPFVGGLFIDDQAQTESLKLEPEGTALTRAMAQFKVGADQAVMVASDAVFVRAAQEVGMQVIDPIENRDWYVGLS